MNAEKNRETLIRQKVGKTLFRILDEAAIKIETSSYLAEHMRVAAQEGVNSESFNKLINLDECLNFSSDEWPLSVKEWIIERLDLISNCIGIDANSKVAELEALGHLSFISQTKPLSESQKKRMPDLIINDDVFVEVYCPQESQNEKKKIEKKLNNQIGLIKMAISHPITGSEGLSLRYQTNKTIDRVLNYKRTHNQCKSGSKNILWLDVKQSMNLNSEDTAPFISKNNANYTWIGCFGLWHAFYGKQENCTFTGDRTSLRFIQENNKYKQKTNGLFRERAELSASLISLLDGIVLFENPWSLCPLDAKFKKCLTKLFRFRPEYSYWAFDESLCTLEAAIENEISRFHWLIES